MKPENTQNKGHIRTYNRLREIFAVECECYAFNMSMITSATSSGVRPVVFTRSLIDS